MELLFFIILLIVFFGIFGDGKKKKTESRSRGVLSPKSASGASKGTSEDYPRDWKNYEAAEQGRMQDDLNPSALYKVSKNRIDTARKAAAEKLSDSLQNFDTTAKTAKNARSSGTYVAKQPPLVRDMNLSRKLFLSGGSTNTFGERQKKSFGLKTVLSVLGLVVIGLYLLSVLGS